MERWQGRVVVVTGATQGIGEAVARKLVTCGMKVAAIARRKEKLNGRVVVVTGATQGIGEAVARKLVTCGMKVAAIARRKEKLNDLEKSANVSGSKGSLKGYLCDVTSNSDIVTTFKAIEKDLGPISVLVNNAAHFGINTYKDLDLLLAENIFKHNVTGVLYCTKAAMESMKNNNIDDGHFVNISSCVTDLLQPEWGLYAASKTALNVIGLTMNNELSREKTHRRVTTLIPGIVITPKTVGWIRANNIVHYLQPEEVADAVVYVISVPKHLKVQEMRFYPYVNELA